MLDKRYAEDLTYHLDLIVKNTYKLSVKGLKLLANVIFNITLKYWGNCYFYLRKN
jgi:hypothetical protein